MKWIIVDARTGARQSESEFNSEFSALRQINEWWLGDASWPFIVAKPLSGGEASADRERECSPPSQLREWWVYDQGDILAKTTTKTPPAFLVRECSSSQSKPLSGGGGQGTAGSQPSSPSQFREIAAKAAEQYYKYEADSWDIYLGHRDKLAAIISLACEDAYKLRHDAG